MVLEGYVASLHTLFSTLAGYSVSQQGQEDYSFTGTALKLRCLIMLNECKQHEHSTDTTKSTLHFQERSCQRTLS